MLLTTDTINDVEQHAATSPRVPTLNAQAADDPRVNRFQ